MTLARTALSLLALTTALALPAGADPGDEAAEATTATEDGAAPDGEESTEDTPSTSEAEPAPVGPPPSVPPTAVSIEPAPGPTSVVVAPEPGPATTPPDERNYVAVVVGISAYANLPDAVELDFGRADAATVAKALRDEADFDEVFLLGDGEATKEAIEQVMRTQVAQLVGPNDMLLFYYAGHGIGADLGLPVILAHDSTLEAGQDDGFEVTTLARDLQTWTRAGTTLIVTDVVHRNQLDGIFFYGPAADAWPQLPVNWMVLSATQGQSPGKDGAFGSVFAEGIAGRADANRDRYVTAAELFAYLVSRLSPAGQIPLATGDYDGGMVIAEKVRGAPPEPAPVVEPAEPDPEPTVVVETVVQEVLPDWTVRAAKFVWEGGSGQTVQCRDEALTACAPSCYVREFKAGKCQLRAIYDGVEMTGEHPVLGPGLYNCRRRGGELECSGP